MKRPHLLVTTQKPNQRKNQITHMKYLLPLTTLLAVAALTGCNQKSTSEPAGELNPAELSDPAKAAAETAGKAIVENMDAAIAAAEEQYKALDAKLAEFAKKAEGYKDDAKAQADKTLADLRAKQAPLNEKLTALKAKSADTWASVKAEFASALAELEKACENAKSAFK